MKIFLRLTAIVAAGTASVLAVQLVIRRLYHKFRREYFSSPSWELGDGTEV